MPSATVGHDWGVVDQQTPLAGAYSTSCHLGLWPAHRHWAHPQIGVQPNCWARASTRKIVLVHATREYMSSGSSQILLPFIQNHDLYDVMIPFLVLTQYRQRLLITGKYFPGSLPIPGGPLGGGTSLQVSFCTWESYSLCMDSHHLGPLCPLMAWLYNLGVAGRFISTSLANTFIAVNNVSYYPSIHLLGG